MCGHSAADSQAVNSVAGPAPSAEIMKVMTLDDTVTLWRPTGPEELALVEASG